MRLLVDEMHTAAMAVALRDRGIDAFAVTEDPMLRGISDEALMEVANNQGRVVVTENVRDFAVIASRWVQERRSHPGIIFTSPRRFHRASNAYPNDVVTALTELAATDWPAGPSEVWWL